ncbi:MAG TPA: ATP-binding cassette domain-containing protein [Anaerolineae bacterium]|nr:ATP-binding cassette domain-containing protein [Anaerolineae bacterium]
MLEIKDLTVYYENALALNSLSLEVRPGEIVGVFGSNSAGKTTLMNTIAGLTLDLKTKEERKGGERITVHGELKFEGEEILHAKPSDRVKKGIVLCRERHPVFRDSSVEENLKIGGFLRPSREVKERIRLVYDIFPHLTRLRRRKGGLLSGGEQQMLAVGMALVAHPRLLLLDEPLLGLSPLLQADIVRAMRDIRQQGITLLVSEQYARPIFPVIDRGYVIENGTLILTGTGPELMNNPEVRSAYFGV